MPILLDKTTSTNKNKKKLQTESTVNLAITLVFCTEIKKTTVRLPQNIPFRLYFLPTRQKGTWSYPTEMTLEG